MPAYTYKCKECEVYMTDVRHSIKEDPVIKCVSCGSEDTFRVIEAPGVHYKANASGLNLTNRPKQSWDWGAKRPNPLQGHRITAEEREAKEQKILFNLLWDKADR